MWIHEVDFHLAAGAFSLGIALGLALSIIDRWWKK